MYKVIIIALHIILSAKSDKVTWPPNLSFNSASNFKDWKLPCSKQTVIFPEIMVTPVVIEQDTSVSGFILPLDGELLLQEGFVELGPTKDNNCTDDENVFYREKSLSSWAQPDVWSSPRFNEATPDAERVPCFDDVVEFPSNSSFSINLPERTQTIRELRVQGQRLSSELLRLLVVLSMDLNQRQQFFLNSNQETGIKIVTTSCKSLAGCQCQKNILTIDCSHKFCPKLTCLNPIQPLGHCCKICGGLITFTVDHSFDITSFKEFVGKIINSYDNNNLVYHIGRLENNKVQLVVVEKGEYLGISAEVVNAINNRMERRTLQESKISGGPLYKSGLTGKLFIAMFFVVVSLFGVIYLYYYKLPEANFAFLTNRSSAFSRFHRRTESVVSLTRRDSGVAIAGQSGFRNPLYDSKRQRVTVEEIVDEDQ